MDPSTRTKSSRRWLPYFGGAVLVCLLIAALTGVIVWQEAERYRERAKVFTQNTAVVLASHIDNVFDRGDALLQEVSYHYNEQVARADFDPQRFNSYLNSLLSWSQDFRSIRLVDEAGIWRLGTGEVVPISVADRDYFVRLRDPEAASKSDAMIFSGPVLTRITNKWVLVLARRLENTNGTFAGIVLVNLNVDDFSALFSTINVGSGGTIVLRNSDMAQVSRYPLLDGPGAGTDNRKVSQQLLDLVGESPAGGSYRAMSPLDGIERYYTFLKIDKFPFYIIVGQAANDFAATWGVNLYLLLTLSCMMILATAAGSRRLYIQAERRSRESIENTAEQILEASPVAMLLFNDKHVVTNANPRAHEQFGYVAGELRGISIDRLHPVSALDLKEQERRNIPEHGYLTSQWLYQRHDGSEFTALRSVCALPSELGQASSFLETVVDITELTNTQMRLQQLAHYDALTSLPNRSLFFDLVDQGLALARREKRPLAILFLDLDKFKPINDTWGHAVGDSVLQQAAQRIAPCLRESDTVGRVGGDEFLILLLNLNSVEDAIRVGEKVRESLNLPFLVGDKTLSISSCIGIALYPDHGSTAIELTANADRAMYHAKETGRNKVVVYQADFLPKIE